jgi:hypothetical protein
MILTLDKFIKMPFDDYMNVTVCKKTSYITFIVSNVAITFVIDTKKSLKNESIIINANKIYVDGVNVKASNVTKQNGMIMLTDCHGNYVGFNRKIFVTHHDKKYPDIISHMDKSFDDKTKGDMLRSIVTLIMIDLDYKYSTDILHGII